VSVLRISLFGTIRVRHEGHPAPMRVTPGSQALLAFLLLQRNGGLSREVLAAQFWKDHSQKRSRSCLNTALWRLRNVLEPDGTPRGTYLLTTSAGKVAFNWESDHWLDVAVFEEQAHRALGTSVPALQEQDVRELQNALRLASRELLEGFYDDWALAERERLRLLYINSLIHLLRYHQHHRNLTEALACAEQILEHDPLREEVVRDLMRLLEANGQRPQALQRYLDYRETLSAELNAPPMEETQALYAEILHQARSQPSRQPAAGTSAMLDQVRQELAMLNRTLEVSEQQLHNLTRLVEALAASPPPEPRGPI
jgi:DNA-binding SARP family transcriptional activator